MEIDAKDLENLITDGESFAILVYQPLCEASTSFEKVIDEFLDEYPITIYKISFSELNDSDLCEFIEYYPSFIIYDSGKLVAYLDANSDKDTEYYKSKESFTKWFSSYVKLDKVNKNNESNDTNIDTNTDNSIEEEIKDDTNSSDIVLKDVVKEEGKVNIYLFWSEGCPYCEAELAYLSSIEEEYGKYYNLYTFETSKSEENREIFTAFALAMDANARGVPFTVIGSEVIIGFNESKEKDLVAAIEKGLDNSFDVYFDKIVGS